MNVVQEQEHLLGLWIGTETPARNVVQEQERAMNVVQEREHLLRL